MVGLTYWDKSAWHPIPIAGDSISEIASFARAPDGVTWAAGSGGIVLAHRPEADGGWERWSGAPDAGLWAAWSDGEDVLVGGFAGVVMEWREGAWRALPRTNGLFGIDALTRIGTEIWAVDDGVAVWDGTRWARRDPGANYLDDVWGASTDDVWVGGDDTLARWTGGGWESHAEVLATSDVNFYPVVIDDERIWASTLAGTLVTYEMAYGQNRPICQILAR